MHFWAVFYEDYTESSIVHSIDVTYTFKFQTALNGGFASANVSVVDNHNVLYRMYVDLLGSHMVVFDQHMRRAYEGFVHDVRLGRTQLDVTALGYYAKGKDIIDDRIYTTSPTTISDIIIDACDLIASWVEAEATQDGASYDLMVTDPDTGSYLALDFTDKRVSEAVESCLVYGYDSTDPQQIYLVIYEGRYPQIVYSVTTLDVETEATLISTANIANRQDTISASLENVYNRVFAVYANEGAGTSKTTAANGSASQSKFGIRDGIVQNGGNPEGLAMAEDLRDYALETYQWPVQSAQVPITGIIEQAKTTSTGVHMVRAGDIVKFTDLDMVAALRNNYISPVRSRIYSQVMGTSFDSRSGINTLSLGSSDNSFDTLMARLGLSGGLS